jgi:cytochrome b involved in lipid metabolism
MQELPQSILDLPILTLDQVSEHNSEQSIWIIMHGIVFDITEFFSSDSLQKHPGGTRVLLKYAGKDATHAFEALYHSQKARIMAKKFAIGRIIQ